MKNTAGTPIEMPSAQVIDIRPEHRSRLRREAKRLREWLLTSPSRLRMPHLGRRVRLMPPLWTRGEQSIRIGDRSKIWHHARLVALNPAEGEIRIDIGANTAIHPYAHITAIRSVRIGAGALLASNVYISDHDHDWRDPGDPPITNSRVLAAPVDIGPGVWLGERVCVLRGVSIGEGSIIGAGSVVTRSVPAHCIAVGAPARVIRRWEEASREWVAVV